MNWKLQFGWRGPMALISVPFLIKHTSSSSGNLSGTLSAKGPLSSIGELFHPLSALPVEDGVSGMWKGDLLYVATQSSIEVIVVQRSKQTHDLNAILSIQVYSYSVCCMVRGFCR